MSCLADLPEIVGFFSYSREDDKSYEGRLSTLRQAIQHELGAQLGRRGPTFRLWQDKDAIPPGTLWQKQINAAISESVFFIPIVTPRAVKSDHCRFEFESFKAREQKLGRNNLIFPILYVPLPALRNATSGPGNPVLSAIAERQYVEWQEFRHADVLTPDMRKMIAEFCESIVEALYQSGDVPLTANDHRAEASPTRSVEETKPARRTKKARYGGRTGPVAADWRSIPGNEQAFDRLRDLLTRGEAISVVGPAAAAGLYPGPADLMPELIRRARVLDAPPDRRIETTSPESVADEVRRLLGPSAFADLLRDVFRPRAGPDGNNFTPLHGALMRLPFKGHIATGIDPGLIEARLQLRPDCRLTGFGTWQDSDLIYRWQTGEIFSEQPCPIMFVRGNYEQPDSIVFGSNDQRRHSTDGIFRRLFDALYRTRPLVFVGFSIADPFISTLGKEERSARQSPDTTAQHVAILGLPAHTEYRDELRRRVSDACKAEPLLYPAASPADDRQTLQSVLDALFSLRRRPVRPPQSPERRRDIVQRWIHETTEDERFTGRGEDLRRLDRWSADPDVRVIAVTGMGGLGKTSLVAHWLKANAATLRRPINGIIFWSVYSDRDIKGLFQAITSFAVERLGAAKPREKPDSAGGAVEALRSAAMLLVIDGLELLQDVPSAVGYGAFLRDELRDLLDGICRARTRQESLVVLTSRFPFADLTPYLGRGVRALDLAHLAPSEGAALLAACDVGGAQAERESVSSRFNGHPLGLRLFALALAQHGDGDPSRALVQQIVDTAGLSDDIPLERKLKHLLEFYEKGMPRLHAALIGVVSFFRSLAPLKTILALARHLPAVAEATKGSSESQLQDALDALSHQHLLVGDPARQAWSCHPILRDHFRQSVLEWAPGIAAGAAGILTERPARDQPKDIHAVESVLAAVELLLDANDFVGADQLFSERLDDGNVFRQLAAPGEGMRCALGFVRDPERRGRCERVLSRKRMATYVKMVGVYARQAGEFDFGSTYFRQCTDIYRSIDDKVELSIALENWTGLLVILGRLEEAERYALEAVRVATEAGADAETKGSLTYVGTVLGKRGKIDAALEAFAKATELELRMNARVQGLFSRRGVRFADLLLRLGRIEQAESLTAANLQICVDNLWREEIAQCWSLLGEIALARSQFDQADTQLRAAEQIFRGGHTYSQIPRILLIRGELERRRKNCEGAGLLVDEALSLAAPRQMSLDHADALLLRARIAIDQAAGHAPAAADAAANRAGDDADTALHIARQYGYAWAERDALALSVRSCELLGSFDRANGLRQEALDLSERLSGGFRNSGLHR